MKRWTALLLSAALLLSPALAAGADPLPAPPDLSAWEELFPGQNSYPGFIDVEAGAWYADAARVCCETGLMMGTGHTFAPEELLTVGEVAAIAARIHATAAGEELAQDGAQPWYFPYVSYLERLGAEVPDPEGQATRGRFVALLSAVLPEEALAPVNRVETLPDTADAAVLSFYNAGILTGVDIYGTFAPERTLTRAECAAMVARIVRPALRQSFSPAPYDLFTAAGLAPADVLFAGGVTAGQYLPCVVELIEELEAACADEGVAFNWFHTYGEQTFLDYVKNGAMARFGVTRADGTALYQTFDVQVFYSRLLDLQGQRGG